MPRKRLWLFAQIVFFAVAVWYFGAKVSENWTELRGLSGTLHPNWWRIAASGGWVCLSYAVLIETWRQTVIAWGARIGWGAATRVWFISNLGRYVPGKVWQIGAMGALAQEAGVSGVAAAGSSLLVNLVNLLAACLVVLLAGSRQLAGPAFTMGLVLFFAAVAAAPWLLPPLARIAQRISGREIPEPRIPPLAIVFAIAGCALAWNLYGIAFRKLAVALFGAPAGLTSAYTAVFTLSYLMGYLAIFAPGGIGVREGVLTSLLATTGLATGAVAVTLVVVSRLWLTVLEAAPGLILLALRHTGSSNASNSTNGPQTGSHRAG
jgi:glycosyltransferase 2 family protein